MPVAERCIQTFWAHATCKLDARFLRVLLQYADLVNNSLEIYAGMEQNGIGAQSALFWKARGRAYEAREDWNNAEAMYQQGVDVLAKPVEMMKSIQTEFEARMFRRLKAEAAAVKNGTAPAPTRSVGLSDPSASFEVYDENRMPLSTLAGASRAGRSASSGGAAPLAANNKKRSSDQLQVYVDDEFATESEKRTRKSADPSTASVPVPIAVVGSLAVESKKENQPSTETWVGDSMPQDPRALAAVARLAKSAGSSRHQPLQVFEDASSASKSDRQGSSTTTARHATAFKISEARVPRGVGGSSDAPYRFTIKSEHYARGSNEPTVTSNGGLEKSAYDRTVVFPGDGKEYSFEEIRAKFYAERAALLATTEASAAPSNTDSQESSSAMIGQEATPAIAPEISVPAAQDTPQQQQKQHQRVDSSPTVATIHVKQQEEAFSQEESAEKLVAEDASISHLDASTKALVSEFESAVEVKVAEDAALVNDAIDQSGRLSMQALSDAIVEPLIVRPLAQFAIFEDQDAQDGAEEAPQEHEIKVVRRGLQARPATATSTVAATPKRSISISSLGSSFGDENDPAAFISTPLPSEKTSAPVDESTSTPPSSSAQFSTSGPSAPEVGAFAPFEDDAPMTPAAAPSVALAPVSVLAMKPLAIYEDLENVAPASVATSAPIVAVVSAKPLDVYEDLENAPPASVASSTPALAEVAPVKSRGRGLSMQSVSALIQSEAEVVQRCEEEEAAKWSYNPEENATMSGFTRRTKDAMDEVMGMFQFDKTMTGISSSNVDFDGNYEVTASIVIPFEHVNRAMAAKNDFAIFEDDCGVADDAQVDSPAPVARRSSFAAPSQDLLIVPYQDENAPAPSNAMAVSQPMPSSNFEVFSDSPETPKSAAPASRLSAMPQFEVFCDGPETPKSTAMAVSEDENGREQLSDVDTPPAPSRLSLILERTVEDDTPEEEGTQQNTSTLNFTMSGITMSGADTTINTQNLGSIIARSNSTKKLNRPVYYMLSMQNPVVDPSTGSVDQKLELTLSASTASGPAPLAYVPEWSQVSQAEQLTLMRDTGLDGIVELLETQSPANDSFQDGASVAFGDDSFLVLQRMAQVGTDSYVYMLESESGETVLAQRGELYDFWACKRLFTKLSSTASSSSAALSAVAIEDLYASLVDYSKAYVFGDCSWLFWPLKVKLEGSNSHNKSQSVPSTTLEKAFTNSLEQVFAMRDAKGYDEIVVWYFAQRLARLQHALHVLGFVAGGRLAAADLFACSPAMDAAVPFVGSRGLVLHRYSSLIDVESYSEGAVFAHLQEGPKDLLQNIGPGASDSWTVEPDMARIAMMVHFLLHGKEMTVEQAAGGHWKAKVAPKMFWNVALWNTYFDMMLNGASSNERIEAVATLCAQVDTFIAAKGTALRFQMGKLNF